jgi:hypothetical protein
VLLAVEHFRNHEVGPTMTRVALVTALALGTLVKWTFLAAAFAVLIVVDADTLRQRRLPWHFALCLALTAVFYLAAGQRIEDLPRLVELVADQNAGFSDAMATAGPLWEILLFLLVAAAGLGLVSGSLWLSRTRFPPVLCLLLSFGALLFVAFKAGFVRHDTFHTSATWAILAVVLFACWLVAPGRGELHLRTVLLTSGLFALGLGVYMSSPQVLDFAARTLVGKPRQALASLVQMGNGWPYWRALRNSEWEDARARIREQRPLPNFPGGVDSIPPLQANLMASDADYRPRPTNQEHQAYTRRTLDADAEFFVSQRAPRFLILQPGSIDNRYPSLPEGALWPLFLSLYEPEQVISDVAVLKRRSAPDPDVHLGQPAGKTARWDEWIAVPEPPVFARIHLKRTAAGRIAKTLFRPPIVTVVIRFSGGGEVSHRLPSGLADAGFVLSPYMVTAQDYIAFASNDQVAMDRARVTAFRLVNEAGRSMDFAETFDVELSGIEFGR